jgi:hypothetical protein
MIEFLAILDPTIANVREQIDHSYKEGWHLPAYWQNEFCPRTRPVGEDVVARLDLLFEKFCSEVSFPPSWSILHKSVLFSDLLLGRR